MSLKTIPITEGRKQLFRIAEDIQTPDTYYSFTVDGKPQVVLMSQSEFDYIMETMEILSDPKILADIEKAEKELEAGQYITWSDLKKEMNFSKSEAFVLKEKPKKLYTASKARRKKK